MANKTPKKNEFREWMDSLKLKAPTVAGRFGITVQTVNHWRSKGVPDSRKEFAARTMAEWSSGSSIGPRIQVQATDEEFRAWNRAALECEGGPKLIEDWAREGLNQMAIEYFNNPQKSLPFRSHLKVHAAEASEKRSDVSPMKDGTHYKGK
jgi:hypothetical protein